MPKNKIRLLTLRTTDLVNPIGMGSFDEIPSWRGALFHSSDLELPLNDRTPRFIRVQSVWPLKGRDDVGVIEVSENPKDFKREDSPVRIRVKGHDVIGKLVAETIEAGGQFRIRELWEVSIDGETIGCVAGSIDNLAHVGKAMIELAEQYIERKVEARKYAF